MIDHNLFTVNQVIDANQLKADLEYSVNDLDNAYSDQSSLFAHYGVLQATASNQVDRFKLRIEQTEAMIYRKLRDQAVLDDQKITEAALTQQIASHSTVRKLKACLNEAKQIEAVTKTAVESFRHRRDMLVQHGFTRREELKGDLYMNQKKDAESLLKDQQAAYFERKKS